MDAHFVEDVAVVQARSEFPGEQPENSSEIHAESEQAEPATLDQEYLAV